jgi:hypothetical protein
MAGEEGDAVRRDALRLQRVGDGAEEEPERPGPSSTTA